MGDVLFGRDGLQVRLDSAAPQILGVHRSFTAVRKRLEPHHGCSVTSHLRLESLLSPLVSCFVHRVVCLVSYAVAAYHARITSIVTSASGNSELDSWLIVKLFCTANRGVQLSTAKPEMSGTPYSMPFFLGKN